MPKNLTVATSNRFDDVNTIMKDPNKKTILGSYVDEVLNLKGKIANYNADIKLIIERAKDELNMDPKLFKLWIAAAYNNDYQTRRTSLDNQVTLLDHLTGEIGFKTAEDLDSDD